MRQTLTRRAVALMLGTIVATLPAATAQAQPQSGSDESTEGNGWSTRLLIMPTGDTLPASSGYVDVIGLGVAQFQAGATDWFSFGAGTLSLVYSGGRPIWITPKAALIRSDRMSAAAGTIHYVTPDGSGGFGYAVATVRGTSVAWTAGVMRGYGDVPAARALILGVEKRRSLRTRFIAEATIFRTGGLAVVGMRRVGKRFTSDFGMAVPLSNESTPLMAFPLVNFGWRF